MEKDEARSLISQSLVNTLQSFFEPSKSLIHNGLEFSDHNMPWFHNYATQYNL